MPGSIDGKYAIEIISSQGIAVMELSGRANDRELHFVRDGSYYAEWHIDLDLFEYACKQIGANPRSILSAGKNEVRIKRLDVPLFGGQIAYYESNLEDRKDLVIKSLGWFDLLKDRQTGINRTFGTLTDIGTWVDAGEIAWTLIDESQNFNANADFGITRGTIQPSVNRFRLFETKPIRDLITQLSATKNGFDFEFSPEKVFNVFYPKMGVRKPELIFSYPGNVKKFRATTDATQLLNYALVRGQGFGEGQIFDERQDLDAQETYKLRQAALDFSDIPDIDTLQDLGDEEISQFKEPLEIIELTLDGNRSPFVGSYWLGDEVRLEVTDVGLYAHVTGYYRIEEIHVKIDENDSEEIQLKLVAV